MRLRVLKVKSDLKQHAVHAAGAPGADDAVCGAEHELQCVERRVNGLWALQPEWMLRQGMLAQRWWSLCARAVHFHLERVAEESGDDVVLFSLVPADLRQLHFHADAAALGVQHDLRAAELRTPAASIPIRSLLCDQQPQRQHRVRGSSGGNCGNITPDVNAHACGIKTVRDLA